MNRPTREEFVELVNANFARLVAEAHLADRGVKIFCNTQHVPALREFVRRNGLKVGFVSPAGTGREVMGVFGFPRKLVSVTRPVDLRDANLKELFSDIVKIASDRISKAAPLEVQQAEYSALGHIIQRAERGLAMIQGRFVTELLADFHSDLVAQLQQAPEEVGRVACLQIINDRFQVLLLNMQSGTREVKE